MRHQWSKQQHPNVLFFSTSTVRPLARDPRWPLEWSSGTKVDLWRCFLLPRLVMGGNGAGWPSESKKT